MLKKNKKICRVELCESELDDVVGFIKDINLKDNLVEVDLINEANEADGFATIGLEKISYVSCDSIDERRIESLIKNQNKF